MDGQEDIMFNQILLQLICKEGSKTECVKNKPDWATMRPDCVSACIDHVTYMERQMDKQKGETAE